MNPYDENRGKTEQVEQMFDAIAPAYDFMNTAMSFGLHRSWRNSALKASAGCFGIDFPERILDVACGTGDVAFELHKRWPRACITGLDLSERMLQVAEEKLKKLDKDGKDNISFLKGNSLELPFQDESFDFITVAYGVRNFENLQQGLKEMKRVLRVGGIICIIELSEPANGFVRSLYRIYARHIIPVIGKMVSGDSRAYSYLPESIAAAPQRTRLTGMMETAGFDDCSWKSLSFGVVTYYIGKRIGSESK